MSAAGISADPVRGEKETAEPHPRRRGDRRGRNKKEESGKIVSWSLYNGCDGSIVGNEIPSGRLPDIRRSDLLDLVGVTDCVPVVSEKRFIIRKHSRQTCIGIQAPEVIRLHLVLDLRQFPLLNRFRLETIDLSVDRLLQFASS